MDPIYAEPEQEDTDPKLWEIICESVIEAFENEGPRFDTVEVGEWRMGWKLHARTGVSVVAAVDQEVSITDLKQFLTDLAQRYFDEVDDARFPEVGGVEDIVVDVIPPWEE